MGERLARAGLIPERIISSNATRAITTARLIAAGLEASSVVQEQPDLYGATAIDLLEFLTNIDAGVTICMVVGHNPTITELANHFSDSSIENVPTCGMLFVKLDRWEQVNLGQLQAFDFPKNPSPAHLEDLLPL